MIPQRNLSLLSNRMAKEGGRRIPEAILERDYCLSWFLVGLSYSPLKKMLLFKGGTAIKKCYVPNYRFSQDLDFTLAEELPFEIMQENLDIAFEYTHQASGINLRLGRQDRHSHENSYTFFLGYEGPLPGTTGKEVKVDITIREKIVYSVEERTVIKGYDEYEDLPEEASILGYSLNEIAVEKVVALLDRARNEPRDLYDLEYLTSTGHVNLVDVVEAVEQKWRYRDKELADVRDEFLRKETRLRKLWNVRLSSQMTTLPEFNKVYRAVFREFRRAGLLN